LKIVIQREENNKKTAILICNKSIYPYELSVYYDKWIECYISYGINVALWNYRGYGFSEGSADFNNVCDDILYVYDYITSNYQYNKIAVHGLSIGGVPACYLASKRNISLVIADRTFGSVQEIINTFPFGNKFLYYLAKIIFFPFVDNTTNFIKGNCKKILMNDPEDKTIIDTFSLKTSISKGL